MKLLLDIDEKDYDSVKDGHIPFCILTAFENAIPITDRSTNGDAIKAIFPHVEVDDYDYGNDPVIDVYGIDYSEYITLRKAWWNAPYHGGSAK